ncbi:unnamed protein product [Brassica oleracea var. botrytis]|uniref:Uncharacterized protein n=1 Tax=Brassica campestris TaxID=3711 RepID=A0A8D9CVE6_BRACM|nr:unnamed protein product [Brassica rapa]
MVSLFLKISFKDLGYMPRTEEPNYLVSFSGIDLCM